MGTMMGTVDESALSLGKEVLHAWYAFEVIPPFTPTFCIVSRCDVSGHALRHKLINLAKGWHVRSKLKFVAVQKNSARTYELAQPVIHLHKRARSQPMESCRA